MHDRACHAGTSVINVHGLFQAALKAPHLVPMEQPDLEVSNFEDLQVGWLVSQFAATCKGLEQNVAYLAHLAVRVANVFIKLPFSHSQV